MIARPFALPMSLLMLASAGCTELVVLATECPPRDDRACISEVDGDTPPPVSMDASVGLDGAQPPLDAPANTGDGSVNPDSFVPGQDDASRWRFPDLLNPSFELTDGQHGDVATVSLPTGTVIAPWFSCQLIGVGVPVVLTGVRAEQSVSLPVNGANPETVMPQQGDTFIAMQYFGAVFPPVLVQALRTPLRAGEHYGLAIDVRTSNPQAKLSLQLYGNSEGCANVLNPTLLALTDPIVKPGWQTVCLRFTTLADQSYLLLAENAGAALSGDRLFFDNARSVEACPP